MPEYHLVGGEGRVDADYRPNGVFKQFLYGKENEKPAMKIKNVRGSIAVIDNLTTFTLNKLHAGNLDLKNPHADSTRQQGQGPRADLHEFDLKYALERIAELEAWRNPEHRERLRNDYLLSLEGYFIGHRLRQLKVSDEKLEEKIAEHRKIAERLKDSPDKYYISSRVKIIENDVELLDELSKQYIKGFEEPKLKTKKAQYAPKTIHAPEVVELASGIYKKLNEVLHFLNPRLSSKEAETYWQRVSEWGNPEEQIFIGCVPGLRAHLERHFDGSKIIGSVFLKSIFKNANELIEYAVRETKDMQFSGSRMEIEEKFKTPVGLDAVVALKDLPSGTNVRTEVRDGTPVNIVSGIERTPTSNLVIVVGAHTENEYGIKTIYPGKLCPPIEDAEFWDKHAFIE